MAGTHQTNGHALQTPQQLREALRQRFHEALAAGKPRTARRLLETFWLWDSFGGSDLWDRVRPRQNDDGDATRWVPPAVPTDRKHGDYWPVWRTQPERDQLLQQARLRVASNAYAQGLLDNLTNNVIGKGYSYTVEARVKKGELPTPEQDQMVEATQAVVDEFLDLNEWNGDADNDSDEALGPSREREIYRRVKEDGEVFIRCHFREESATTLIRIIDPECVRDQGGVVPQEGWSHGIQHQMKPFEDVQTLLNYSVFFPDPTAPGGEGGADNVENYQIIPAAEVVHAKGLGTPSTVKRGLSFFLFDVGAALDRAAKGQRNASMSAGHRAATAEIWQHQTATQASITNLQQTLGYLASTDNRTGQPQYTERTDPATVRRIPAGQEVIQPPEDYSEQYLMAFQGDLRQAAAAACAPEFWMAETSSGNYSNLESAAAPAVRAGLAEQEYFKKVFRRVLWKAIKWAAECGRLPADVREQVRINVEAPAVLHRNELEKAQEDQIGVQNQWKDPQTCAEERGLDWDQVQRRMEEHQKTQLDQQVKQASAMQQFAPKPGEGGDGKPGDGGGGGGGFRPPGPPKIPGAPRIPAPGLPQRTGGQVREGFDPSEPRDERGEWTSGGGGGKAGKKPPADDEVHSYLGAFNDPGEGGEPATAKDAREANRELKASGSKFRVVPDGKGKWEARHVADLKDDVGDDWHVFTNPLTGEPDLAGKDYAAEMTTLSGDRATRSYLTAFNDRNSPGTAEDAAAANKELADDGSEYRLEFNKDYNLWTAVQRDAPVRESVSKDGRPGPHPDPDAAAPLIAEILHHLFGDDALDQIEGPLTEAWNPEDHPRGPDGRFIKRGSPQAVKTAQKVVGDALKGQGDAAHVAKHLAILNVDQLKKLHAQHGVKKIPSYIQREHLVQAVHDRLKAATDRHAADAAARAAKAAADKAAYAARGQGEPKGSGVPDETGIKPGAGNGEPEQSRTAFRDALKKPGGSREARTAIYNAMWGGHSPSHAADELVKAGYPHDAVHTAVGKVADRLAAQEKEGSDDFTPERLARNRVDAEAWLSGKPAAGPAPAASVKDIHDRAATASDDEIASIPDLLKGMSADNVRALGSSLDMRFNKSESAAAMARKIHDRVADMRGMHTRSRLLDRPAAAHAVDIHDPKALADAVHDAGKNVPDLITGETHEPGRPAYRAHKPPIADVYDALKPRLGGATLDEFKAALAHAGQSGHIELARHDLTGSALDTRGGMDTPAARERVRRSETRHPAAPAGDLLAVHHTVNTNSAAARKSAPARESVDAVPETDTVHHHTHIHLPENFVKLPESLVARIEAPPVVVNVPQQAPAVVHVAAAPAPNVNVINEMATPLTEGGAQPLQVQIVGMPDRVKEVERDRERNIDRVTERDG